VRRAHQAYTSQYIVLVMLALLLGEDRVSLAQRRHEIIQDLRTLPSTHHGRLRRKLKERRTDRAAAAAAREHGMPGGGTDKVKRVLNLNESLKELVRTTLVNENSLLIMGRGYQHATCLEGSLVRAAAGRRVLYIQRAKPHRPSVVLSPARAAAQKIKEISYLHSEGVLAGELKHGPLALVDETMPVALIMPRDCHYEVRPPPVAWIDADCATDHTEQQGRCAGRR